MKAVSLFLIAILSGSLACISLSGCVSSRPYHTTLGPRPDAAGRLPAPSTQKGALACTSERTHVDFIELDDYGNLMNRAQMLAAMQQAACFARDGGTIWVYVHGWHHSADETRSSDILNFNKLIEQGAAADARRHRYSGAGRILGIYVGWRGDSIRSHGASKVPSYALTFWDRKSAAHNIGTSGSVYELFSRLSDIRNKYPDSKLLIEGHSFGGAVVYSAVSNSLIDQIRRDGADSGVPHTTFADLVLLVNPAFEAMKLRPQLDLARSQEYKSAQPPRLVIVTTEADWATKNAFALGRSLGSFGKSYTDRESAAENKTAVGHYLPYITHQLAAANENDCTEAERDGTQPNLLESYRMDEQPLAALTKQSAPILCVPRTQDFSKAVPLVLTRCDEAGFCSAVADQHYIARGAVACGYVPYRLPIMNIRATREVSGGHNDIWGDTLQNFIAQLMTLARQDPISFPMAPPE